MSDHDRRCFQSGATLDLPAVVCECAIYRMFDEAFAEVQRLRAFEGRVRDLFAAGPDTPCRTTHPDGVECVEVPMEDLRAAFDHGSES